MIWTGKSFVEHAQHRGNAQQRQGKLRADDRYALYDSEHRPTFNTIYSKKHNVKSNGDGNQS